MSKLSKFSDIYQANSIKVALVNSQQYDFCKEGGDQSIDDNQEFIKRIIVLYLNNLNVTHPSDNNIYYV